MTLVRIFDALITVLKWITMLLHKHLSWFLIDGQLRPGMEAAMRSELKKYYHSSRKSVHGRETKIQWTSHTWELCSMSTWRDSMMPVHCLNLRRFCNKSTALYWTPRAQIKRRHPLLLFACAYKEWFRAHGNDPNIEFGAFFANPIRIALSGPRTVAGILEAHRSLCNQAVGFWKRFD